MMRKRAERLKGLMINEQMDAILALSLENVFYSTGAFIVSQQILPQRLEIGLFSEKGEDVFIICGIEESSVREQTWIKDIRPYIEFKESPVDFLVEALKEKGLEKGRIGIEKEYINVHQFNQLLEALPNAEFVECRHIFDQVRKTKEPGEIEILAKAAKETRQAVDAALLIVKPGQTERQLANQIINNLMIQGHEPAFLVLGTGKRSVHVHPIPADIPMQLGDIVYVDFGVRHLGYLSDIARTAVVGKPSKDQAEVYRKIITIERKLIENMKIGVRFCDLYNSCQQLYAENGLPPIALSHIGHGLGIGLHEEPVIHSQEKEKMEQNYVHNLELSVNYQEQGYVLEDTVHITPEGPKILTEASLNESIPVIE
jgi:Xaa-Pro dipeptidase